jgi:hypothetical protein
VKTHLTIRELEKSNGNEIYFNDNFEKDQNLSWISKRT